MTKTYYTLPEAKRIAQDLVQLEAFDLCSSWASATVRDTIDVTQENWNDYVNKHFSEYDPKPQRWNQETARHFVACETRIRQVNDRFLLMDGLWDSVKSAEDSRFFNLAPPWAKEAVTKYLDDWDKWEEKGELQVYSENKIGHVRSALNCIRNVNTAEETKATPADKRQASATA